MSMLEVSHLTKQFGHLKAVDDLSFQVQPSRVTGFLGPNGAGKTTTLRMALGLIRATAGTVTFDGQPYHQLPKPMSHVGAALEASSFHPGRTARNHLLFLAPSVGASKQRCDEVLELVGLGAVAKKRVKGFSLGMRGRLSLAATLLGDPQFLLLDEPTNGLDPEGIAWMRGLMRHLASEGRTILISSHLLSEVQQTVDDVIIIAQGKMVHSSPLTELDKMAVTRSIVTVSQPETLVTIAGHFGWQLQTDPTQPDSFIITGPSARDIGHACFTAGVEIYQLAQRHEGLEEIFLSLTEGRGGVR
ncbi:MAG: ABC transporter ATP-binding protein [Propionibacteriaceae bacterium]|jgi:ABC-2 type transport system ATP-binding protein|nr:ABC transporter ATP-binding protein [Propionibacteriaceae bacterium]